MPRTKRSTTGGKSRIAMRRASKRKWSADVTERSDALDLEKGVFAKKRAEDIARSLKRSAEHSRRRKSAPFRSAMSMLNFHLNRGGRTLPAAQRRVLERAKDELRALYGRASHARKTHHATRPVKAARRKGTQHRRG